MYSHPHSGREIARSCALLVGKTVSRTYAGLHYPRIGDQMVYLGYRAYSLPGVQQLSDLRVDWYTLFTVNKIRNVSRSRAKHLLWPICRRSVVKYKLLTLLAPWIYLTSARIILEHNPETLIYISWTPTPRSLSFAAKQNGGSKMLACGRCTSSCSSPSCLPQPMVTMDL